MDSIDGFKTCTKCNTLKPLDAFGREAKSADGHKWHCKDCGRTYQQRWRAENAERIAERKKQYYAENKERIAESQARYRAEHKDEISESGKRYREANKEKIAAHSRVYRERTAERQKERKRQYYAANRERDMATSRQWAERNREQLREYKRRYAEANRERIIEYKREYRKNKPDMIRDRKLARRAREVGAEGSHTAAEWQAVVWRQGFACALCGEVKPLTRDHVIPLSRGGTNDIGNIQGLCKPCNSSKGARLPEEMTG